ncbi:hypothetical protein CVT25_013146 [Psilocybe cyanescens]|uniref:Uncharacterized protein n=1 Tax=Psilocybe cyanescens TaxID=93625 RepID=A0A409XK38_PSICY|nr:hypothetical protein CVT25_013146 [Psilocybe cyanescens]
MSPPNGFLRTEALSFWFGTNGYYGSVETACVDRVPGPLSFNFQQPFHYSSSTSLQALSSCNSFPADHFICAHILYESPQSSSVTVVEFLSDTVVAQFSVTVTPNITSISVPTTSTPPKPVYHYRRQIPGLTSLPPSTSTSEPPTNPPHFDSTSSDTSPSSTPLFFKSTTLSLSFPGAMPLESITTIVTSINGQVTTFTSQLPTSLVDATPNNSGSFSRTAVIAGTTAGLIVLLCLALAIVFGNWRYRVRSRTSARGKKAKTF